MPSDPIRIKPGAEGRLIVSVPYSPERVAKIKTVAGRRWHAKERHWTVPPGDGTLGNLLELFPGKSVDVDWNVCVSGFKISISLGMRF